MPSFCDNKLVTCRLIMNNNDNDRYVRWQNNRISHLSYSINLFLGFAVASLAFAISFKLNKNISINIPINLIIICWSYSAFIGCAATVTKLIDYRCTASKIRKPGKINTFIAKHCGTLTWGLFWSQIITYIIGSYFFITSLINA